jgi:hypothetical protein
MKLLISLSSTLSLKTDNPGGRWLKEEQEYNASKGVNQFGAPNRFGSTTAWFTRNVLLPVSLLSTFKGLRGEQSAVRTADLNWLKKHMDENKRLPTISDSDARHYAPYINVWQDGTPYVNEGNHRIMAAKSLGFKYLPVELSYFGGGEKAHGILTPNDVIKHDKEAQKFGKTLENYV